MSTSAVMSHGPGKLPPHVATTPLRMARIVVGIDTSDVSLLALRAAADFATIFNTKLFLVHAVTPIMLATGLEQNDAKVLQVALDQAKKQIEWMVKRSRVQSLQPITTIGISNAADLINQVALTENADLIVVGSHRLSPLERATMGSVSETVLHRAACPVLVVGPACHHKLSAFRKIVFATDLATTGLHAAQYALWLTEIGNGRLTLLHVADRTSSRDTSTAPAYLEERLQILVPDHVALLSGIKTRVEYGAPAEVIPAVLESEEATLLVLGSREEGASVPARRWSILPDVLRDARCPVLLVRNHPSSHQRPSGHWSDRTTQAPQDPSPDDITPGPGAEFRQYP